MVEPVDRLRTDSPTTAGLTIGAALTGDDDDESLAVVRRRANKSADRGLRLLQGAAVKIETAVDRHLALGKALGRPPVDASVGS